MARASRFWIPSSIVALALVSSTAAAADEHVHVVARGQTLGAIAKRYHTTLEALRDANDLKPGARIRPGLPLVIPDEGSGAKSRRTASRVGRSDRRAARATESASPFEIRPKRPGFVHLVRGNERADVQVLTRQGHLAPGALAGVSRILRYFPTNTRVAIDARLATLLGMVSDHFGGRTIRIVSGYRPYFPAQYAQHSNHNAGKAVDFVVDGVPAGIVSGYCRTLRNGGVGYYPNSTFVHLDVRTTSAYWVDYSKSGEPPRYDPAHDSAAADEAVSDLDLGSSSTQSDPRQHKGISDSADSEHGKAEIQGSSGPTSSDHVGPGVLR